MRDDDSMIRLKSAWELILNASKDEKSKLFEAYVEALENHKERLGETENRLDPHSYRAYRAMDVVERFFRHVTGYNASWVSDKFLEHCSQRSARRRKYDFDTRSVNCFFIAQMVSRGSSETQAMKLLMRLRGDSAMTQGHLRELRDTYGDFKKLGRPTEDDLLVLDNAVNVARFLEFDISNLNSDEKASEKAVTAFRDFYQELIDLMKSHHALVASRDSSYPEIFGPVIRWLEANYDDPLDYFYRHETHSSVPFEVRRRCLLEYLNTVSAFTDDALP